MKKILSILLCVLMLLTFSACSQEEAAPTEEVLTAYKSAVKESAVITCGEETLNVVYVYKEGNLIKETFTSADGTAYSNFYIYNDNGQCTSEVQNNPDETKDKYRHTIDANGVLVKTVHTEPTNSKNTTVYAYSEDGVCTGYTLTYASKDVQEAAYTYNELGAVSQIDVTGFEPSVTTFEYDEFGNVVKETVTANGAETVTTYTYTYQQ